MRPFWQSVPTGLSPSTGSERVLSEYAGSKWLQILPLAGRQYCPERIVRALYDALMAEPPPDARAAGMTVVESVRELLANNLARVTELTSSPTPMSQYTAIALVAATVRWASHETGRSEDEILNELATNYER